MRKLCTAAALSAALLIPVAMRAEDHHDKRVTVYVDPYNHDRHEWNDHEQRAYRHWMEQERHQQYRDWKRLNKREQREYWQWRHNNMDWHE
jgi:hypothetical protein